MAECRRAVIVDRIATSAVLLVDGNKVADVRARLELRPAGGRSPATAAVSRREGMGRWRGSLTVLDPADPAEVQVAAAVSADVCLRISGERHAIWIDDAVCGRELTFVGVGLQPTSHG